jgi:hypothetical protein
MLQGHKKSDMNERKKLVRHPQIKNQIKTLLFSPYVSTESNCVNPKVGDSACTATYRYRNPALVCHVHHNCRFTGSPIRP